METKKQKYTTFVFQIVMCIILCLISYFSGFFVGYKTSKNIDNKLFDNPVVLVEQKRSNDYMNYSIPKQTNIIGSYITEKTTTYPFQNFYAVRAQTYGYLDIIDNYLYGINGYCVLCVSDTLRYDSTINNYIPTFSEQNNNSFDFFIDIKIDLSNNEHLSKFNNIELNFFLSDFDGTELEITMDIYIDNHYYNQSVFYYDVGRTLNIYQFFDYNSKTEFINRTFLITYNGGYEDGYTIGYGQAVNKYKETTEYTDSVLDRIWGIFTKATSTVFNVFSLEIIPGIPIFAVLIIPIIVAVVLFIFKVIGK